MPFKKGARIQCIDSEEHSRQLKANAELVAKSDYDRITLGVTIADLAGRRVLCKQKRRTARRYGVEAVLLLQDLSLSSLLRARAPGCG